MSVIDLKSWASAYYVRTLMYVSSKWMITSDLNLLFYQNQCYLIKSDSQIDIIIVITIVNFHDLPRNDKL